MKVLSLLSPHESVIADDLQRLLDRLKSTRQLSYRLARKVHPSTFIQEKSIPSGQHFAHAYYNGVIDLAVVEDEVYGRIKCAILDVNNKNSGAIEDLLRQYEIVPVSFDSLRAQKPDFDQIEKALKATTDSRYLTHKPLSGMSNPGEEWIFKLVKTWQEDRTAELREHQIYAKPFVGLFQEASLCSFLNYPAQADWAHLRHWRTSRVDLLVTTSGRELLPLLVVEMDGPDHLKPEVQIKDRMKEKLLGWAGIPLIRVTLTDMPFEVKKKHDVVVDLWRTVDYKFERGMYETVALVLLQFIWLAKGYQMEEENKNKTYEKKSLDLLRQKLNDEKRKSRSLVVPLDRVLALLEDVESELQEERSSVDWTEVFNAGLLRDYFEEQIDVQQTLLAKQGASISKFHLASEGKTATAHADLVTPAATYPIAFPYPTFRLIGDANLNTASFEDSIKKAVYLLTVSVANELLEASG